MASWLLSGFCRLVPMGLITVVGCGSEADAPAPGAGMMDTSASQAGTVTSGATSTSTSSMGAANVTSSGASTGGVTSGGATTQAANTATSGAATSTTGSAATGGVIVDGTCRLLCVDDSTDADDMGVTDGWGFENGQSCIVPGGVADSGQSCSDPVLQGGPEDASAPGTGVTVGGMCTLVCLDAVTDADDSGSTDGWGWERGMSCVVPGSPADPGIANACALDIPMSTPGAMVDDGSGACVPVCMDASTDDTGDGWGYENEVSCIVPGGRADTGIAC